LVGLPTTPGAMGVDASVIEKAAARAMRDLTTMTNPRPPERADYAEIIRQAL
jgi:alcohol dehydrogenase class IV